MLGLLRILPSHEQARASHLEEEGHKDRDPACLTHPSEGFSHGSEVFLGHLTSAKPTQTRSTAKLTTVMINAVSYVSEWFAT